MTRKYTKHVQTKKTKQSEPILGSGQVPNSAGGFAWAVDDWARLNRFLILGSEGGTYYISEKKLTRENADAVLRAIKEDGKRVVDTIVAVSEAGRAPKNTPALFGLAMAASLGNDATKAYALAALPRVARIGTHLFQFADALYSFRGNGRASRRAFRDWYLKQPIDRLAFQVVKYQQREGWSHRDLLRKNRPKPTTIDQDMLFNWVVKSGSEAGYTDDMYANLSDKASDNLRIVVGLEKAKRAKTEKEIVSLIKDYRLPREVIESANTEWLKSVKVWDALLPEMPMEAMIRNLGVMTTRGLLKPMSDASKFIVDRLSDEERIRKARIHPIKVLAALITYGQGAGARSRYRENANTWTPVQPVVDALDAAFYKAFGNVRTTGKRIMLALDVSGSMAGGEVSGIAGMTPRVAAAALGLVTAAVEPNHVIVAFQSASGKAQTWMTHHGDDGIVPLNISPRQRLDDVVKKTDNLPFGGTDCALPMLYASAKKLSVDAFVVLTDSETWAGDIHPTQALQEYRRETGLKSKLVVVAMTSNGFTIADPNDPGMLDVVGFDTAVPDLMAEFIVG